MFVGVPTLDLEQVPANIYITRGLCDPRTVCVQQSCPQQMQRTMPWRVEDFHLHKQLYKGKASLLYSATCRLSGLPIALKLYRKEKLSNLNWFQVEREIRIHSQLRHENIIQLFAAFEDAENVYLAQEYAAGGDLYEDLKSNGGRIAETRVAASIIYPCMQALSYLHKLGIIHRDIKSENILLTASGTVKLADFGLSINHREERPVTRAGTLDMMAPEVLVCPEKSRPEENKERAMLEYTCAVDAWAVGIVAFELLVGHPPFEKESRSETYEHIMYRAPVMPPIVTEGARNFIASSLVKAVSKRPSIEELLKHPWVNHHLGLLSDNYTGGAAILGPKKQDSSSGSVRITVDCTIGGKNSSSAGSNASSSGSAEQQEGQQSKSDNVETSKPSVLQWAGSSLKTITKKLRKPVIPHAISQTPAAQVADAQPRNSTTVGVEAFESQVAHRELPQLHVATSKSDCSSTQSTLPEAAPGSPFSSYAAVPESTSSLATKQKHSSRMGHPPLSPASSLGCRQGSFRTFKLPPPVLTHSLSSLVLGDEEQEATEAEKRRTLLATKNGLEAHPPSPPAYLSRPWMTRKLPKLNTELPSTTSPMQTPSPLARRRRRIAGNMDSSSSGSMALADTPQGGHFPSGPRSARTFGRTVNLKQPVSPVKRITGEGSAKHTKSHSTAYLSRTTHWSTLSPTSSTLTARPEQGASTLPRDLGVAREAVLNRAASAAPVPVARKLSLEPAEIIGRGGQGTPKGPGRRSMKL